MQGLDNIRYIRKYILDWKPLHKRCHEGGRMVQLSTPQIAFGITGLSVYLTSRYIDSRVLICTLLARPLQHHNAECNDQMCVRRS
jgi:hypothetical protein